MILNSMKNIYLNGTTSSTPPGSQVFNQIAGYKPQDSSGVPHLFNKTNCNPKK